VSSSALFNAVNESLARRQGNTDRVLRSTRVDAIGTLWLADLRVLLVDDSDINLEVARRLLIGRGALVRTCTSGQQALDCLRAGPTDFDAVLMDVQMPDMDGLEATRRLRDDLGLLTLPVIALTAGALVAERRRALDAGMQGFLPKPLDPVQLVRVLRGCVESARGAILPVTTTAEADAVTTGCKAAPEAVQWPAIAGIDAVDAAQRLGNDLPLFLSLLHQLLAEFADLVCLPESAVEDGEPDPALAARMHKLRGSASTLGARELHRMAQAAEASLRAADAGSHAAVRQVSESLCQLAAASAGLLAAASRADTPEACEPHPGAALPGPVIEQIGQLLQQIRSHDLAALLHFRGLRASLSQALGSASTSALSAALEALDFKQADRLLETGLAQTAAEKPQALTITD
jgi:CheY-like chemotaxis protein